MPLSKVQELQDLYTTMYLHYKRISCIKTYNTVEQLYNKVFTMSHTMHHVTDIAICMITTPVVGTQYGNPYE